MKRIRHCFTLFTAGLTVLAGMNATAAPLGTVFTYQGELTDGTNVSIGNYDLEFTLYDAESGGLPVGSPLTNSLVNVTNGLFTVTLDFGSGVFAGEARWLQVAARTNGGGAFVALSPRQPLTAAPYALYAPTAGAATVATTAATVAANGVINASLQTGAVTSDKIADGTIAPADLNATLASNTFWRLGGNAGTTPGTHFLGTTDNQPLELKANNQRALRLEYASNVFGALPNVVGGAPANVVAPGVVAATIGGGGENTLGHRVAGDFSTIAGGRGHVIEGFGGTIGGGQGNTIRSNCAYSTIAGGYEIEIDPQASDVAIGGGSYHRVQTNADNATIGGGYYNVIGTESLASTISGGKENAIQSETDYASVGGGFQNEIQTFAQSATISGGEANTIQDLAKWSTIGGGMLNTVQPSAHRATIGGGGVNTIRTNADAATISGGRDNVIQPNAQVAAIGGGYRNTNSGSFATVPGGRENSATNYAFAAGRRAKANHEGAFVWADSTDADFVSTTNNQFNLRASGGVRLQTSGAGLDVDGTVRATALAGNGSGLTSLGGGQILWGTVAESRIDPAITRDAEIVPTLLANDGPGSGLDADRLDGLDSTALWRLSGNIGTVPGTHFLGTTDNQPLELKANGARALRLEPNATSPNVIAGFSGNYVAPGVAGAAIGGGGQANASNVVRASHAVVGGGFRNEVAANAGYAVIAGGYWNAVSSLSAQTVVGGGQENRIEANASGAVIAGGYRNTVLTNGDWAAIPGGSQNSAANHAFAAGYRAKANHTGSFVWADSTEADFASTAPNQFLVRASGGVGIGAAPVDAALDVEGDTRINGHDLLLRDGSDRNHGLGYYGSWKPFGGTAPDGPVLYGWAGGGLGTKSGGEKSVVAWTKDEVAVNGNLRANNLPGLQYGQGHSAPEFEADGEEHRIDEISIRVPAAGYLFITAFVRYTQHEDEWLEFSLYDVTDAPMLLTEAYKHWSAAFDTGTLSLSWVYYVGSSKYVNLKTTAHATADGSSSVDHHNLTAIYFPVRYQ